MRCEGNVSFLSSFPPSLLLSFFPPLPILTCPSYLSLPSPVLSSLPHLSLPLPLFSLSPLPNLASFISYSLSLPSILSPPSLPPAPPPLHPAPPRPSYLPRITPVASDRIQSRGSRTKQDIPVSSICNTLVPNLFLPPSLSLSLSLSFMVFSSLSFSLFLPLLPPLGRKNVN